MPSTQEFALIVDQNTLIFIQIVTRLFLALALGLALAFSFVVVALYCSAKLLIAGYTLMRLIMARVEAERARKYEVIS